MGRKRIALVTGASARIGLAIATHLVEAGFAVALHASPRSYEAAVRHARRLCDGGGEACALAADLSDVAACGELVADARQQLGPTTLLVNNAALFEPDSPDRIDVDLWDRHFQINLRAPIILSERFAAAVSERDHASIVNVIDQRVLHADAAYFSYTLAKSALWTATRAMAKAYARRGIRVNAIGPGPVLPNMHEGPDGFEREVAALPLPRGVAPEDIAAGVLYLAGAEAVTGQMIAIDAGQHLG